MIWAPFTLALIQGSHSVDLSNGRVTVSISRQSGRFTIKWGDRAEVDDANGQVVLPDGTRLSTDELPLHEVMVQKVKDSFGSGDRLTVLHRDRTGQPSLRQTFWLYRGRNEVMVRLDLIDDKHGTNRITPIACALPIRLRHKGPLQSMFVPYDNDSYVRYSSSAWDQPDGSYEVGAVYDDASRAGLVVGSIDHDVWKSAVKFDKVGGFRAYAGVADRFTQDKEPHGTVTGSEVRSPRFELGLYSDWRKGLERYGDLNAIVQPPLPWNGGVPFGWNSWSGYKTKVDLPAMVGALAFVKQDLPSLRNKGVAYLNFDSFWDNLTRQQRVDYVKRVHAAGFKAGIYWTPFVNWGEPDWKAVGGFLYRDLQLKDTRGTLLPKLDGGWPLDPTHPGTLQRIDENLRDFVDQGFDYVKLDFLTHGSLEGRHFDPKVQTGTAAYRIGMQRIVDDLSPKLVGRPFFISLSIAPLFPSGYGHSRRISCDVFSNIGASEYMLNSQNYAWWEAGRLYRFCDPDSACEYQALGESPTTEAEARTRFTASVISGGMMIDGDALTDPASQARVREIFSNRDLLDLAKQTPQFRPVFGDTGDKAGCAFIHMDRDGSAYVAAFNYDKTHFARIDVLLDRLGLPPGVWNEKDLWSGRESRIEGSVHLDLPPMDCALVRLTRIDHVSEFDLGMKVP